MGVRRCLARSLTSLALLRTPKSANGPRSNSFRPDSPSTTNFPRGRKTQPSPSPHRTWSVPDASSQPQLNLQYVLVTARPPKLLPLFSTVRFCSIPDCFSSQYFFIVFIILLQQSRGVQSIRTFSPALSAMDAVLDFFHLRLAFLREKIIRGHPS